MSAAEPQRLGPMTVGEILVATIATYRANPWLFTGIVAAASLPVEILQWLILSRSSQAAIAVAKNGTFVVRERPFIILAAAAVLGLIFMAPAQAAASRALACLLRGYRVRVRDAYRGVGPVGIAITIMAAALYFLATGLGAAAFLIPGIAFAIFLQFYPQRIAIDGYRSPLAALAASFNLVGSSWFRVLGLVIVVEVTANIIPFVVAALVPIPLGDAFQMRIVALVLNVVFYPIQYIGLTFIYLDLRVRREGLTTERLAAEVGGG